jgi:hypothetical protein
MNNLAKMTSNARWYGGEGAIAPSTLPPRRTTAPREQGWIGGFGSHPIGIYQRLIVYGYHAWNTGTV